MAYEGFIGWCLNQACRPLTEEEKRKIRRDNFWFNVKAIATLITIVGSIFGAGAWFGWWLKG